MTKKELLARIEWLEARVQQLEAERVGFYPYWSVIPPVPNSAPIPWYTPNTWFDSNTGNPPPRVPQNFC